MEFMTEFLLQTPSNLRALPSKQSSTSAQRVQQFLTDWLELNDARKEVAGTEETQVLDQAAGSLGESLDSAVSQAEAYPHAFDESVPEGMARESLVNALDRVSLAIDALEEGDIQEIASRLAQAAVSLRAAHQKLGRDNPLSALVGYMKRGVLTADAENLTRAPLEAMAAVLRKCADAPVMRITEAARLSASLERNGWAGDDSTINALAAAVLERPVAENVVRTQSPSVA